MHTQINKNDLVLKIHDSPSSSSFSLKSSYKPIKVTGTLLFSCGAILYQAFLFVCVFVPNFVSGTVHVEVPGTPNAELQKDEFCPVSGISITKCPKSVFSQEIKHK